MKPILISLSIAALAAGGVAYAQQDSRPRFDADGNGVITRAEAQAAAGQMFARLDANRDGKIDTADREARRAALFERIDTDHNGQLSRAEFLAMGPGRGPDGAGGPGPDGDTAGKAGGRGWHGRGGHRGGGMMLRMADANGDKTITQAEFTSAALTRFDTMDGNKDGKVTKEERQAARAAMRGHWQHRMGPGSDGPDGPPPPPPAE